MRRAVALSPVGTIPQTASGARSHQPSPWPDQARRNQTRTTDSWRLQDIQRSQVDASCMRAPRGRASPDSRPNPRRPARDHRPCVAHSRPKVVNLHAAQEPGQHSCRAPQRRARRRTPELPALCMDQLLVERATRRGHRAVDLRAVRSRRPPCDAGSRRGGCIQGRPTPLPPPLDLQRHTPSHPGIVRETGDSDRRHGRPVSAATSVRKQEQPTGRACVATEDHRVDLPPSEGRQLHLAPDVRTRYSSEKTSAVYGRPRCGANSLFQTMIRRRK